MSCVKKPVMTEEKLAAHRRNLSFFPGADGGGADTKVQPVDMAPPQDMAEDTGAGGVETKDAASPDTGAADVACKALEMMCGSKSECRW